MRSFIQLPRLSVKGWRITISTAATLLGFAPLLCADEAANNAKNIARVDCGATIERVSADREGKNVAEAGSADLESKVLIADDPTMSYALPQGETTFVLSFPNASTLDRFTFVNENAKAEGELTISVSNYRLPATSPKWTNVDGAVAFTHHRLFNLSMVGVEARYVKLSFHVQKAGRIASLGLFGGESLNAYAAKNAQLLGVRRTGNSVGERFVNVSDTKHPNNSENAVNFNFANVYAKAHVVYVSSGPLLTAARMIDDDTATSYRFAADDRHPTVIIELAETERLHRVSTLISNESGRLEVFLLNELKADRGDLRDGKLAGSMVERNGDGKVAVNFDPEGARYVALRWTAEQGNSPAPFEVAEVKAFGEVALSMLNLDAVPESFAMNMSTAAAAPQMPPEIPILSR